MDVVLAHGVSSAGQPVVGEVGRGNVFGCGQRRCCPSEGVTKGEKAAVCEVYGVVEYMVGCLHQVDVSHVAYRWETRPDTVVRHE